MKRFRWVSATVVCVLLLSMTTVSYSEEKPKAASDADAFARNTLFDVYVEAAEEQLNVVTGVYIYSMTDFAGRPFLVLEKSTIAKDGLKVYVDLERVRAIVPSSGVEFKSVTR